MAGVGNILRIPRTGTTTDLCTVIPRECKRLVEVDFPIAEVSKYAAREKSIRHGHPSTLHLWWARRPLASSRAVLLALLLPDPCDPNCPDAFKRQARDTLREVHQRQCCHILFNYDIPWNPNRLEQRMGRIHRYGQRLDCLIFNFVATNTIEGRVLQRLLDKLQEIRDALDDDAVFNVVGEVLPSAHVERVLRDFYAGKLGEEDFEDRLLKDVDEDRFRSIYPDSAGGLAAKKLNLTMLIERRARVQERRVVPESIARFITECAGDAALALRPVGGGNVARLRSRPHAVGIEEARA